MSARISAQREESLPLDEIVDSSWTPRKLSTGHGVFTSNLAFCHKCGRELPPGAAFCPACGTPLAGTAEAVPSPPLGQTRPVQKLANYATVGDRAVAVILDTVILLIATSLFAIPIGLLGAFGTGAFPLFFFGTFTLLWWLVWLVYFSFFEGTSGQTLGKQALGIRVVDEVSQRPVTMERAVLRNILRIIDWLPFLYLVGFILVETQPGNKRLGDTLAKTIVVKA